MAAQRRAVTLWWNGKDPAGQRTTAIAAPTLIADGGADWVDPVANGSALAVVIPAARTVLYPDAAHAFLFQDGVQFATAVESFIKTPTAA